MSDITKEMLQNPPKMYRSLPFWSWNSKLDVDETRFQVKEMDENGIGGYFMHARGGLKTEYMSDEWMDNVRAAVLDGDARGMAPWGYDENGWPSGFGSGVVNGMGVKYQQKYLHMEETDAPVEDEFTVGNVPTANGKNRHFFFSVNRFYVDTMDAEVTDAFIKSTHEKYKEALGEDFHKMAGFFTDEPQMSRKPKGIPWSMILPREYKKAYGEELLPVLADLFVTPNEKVYRTRFRYQRLVTRLFSENFMKRIYDWCLDNDTRLTGHMVCEETYASQLDCNGSCMPNYLYMSIPGCDKLGRGVGRDLLTPQLTSVCAQAGKKQILTESFAMCGWDVTFEELKWILEWQMVKGVNLLCQHLEGYSLGGLRKRDYPSGHFFQNPWWKDYKAFMDFAARVGMLLAEGEIKCDVLVLHTISSAWIYRCDAYNWQSYVDGFYWKKLTDTITALDKHQILHHLGDETVMEELGMVSGNVLKVGEMSYKTVIVPSAAVISSNTYNLLKQFKDNGGRLIFVGEIPSYIDGEKTDKVRALAEVHVNTPEEALPLIPDTSRFVSFKHADGSACDVQYARRGFDDYTMYYFVNTYSGHEDAVFEAEGKSMAKFDYMTGEVVPYPFTVKDGKVIAGVSLEAKGSVIFFVYDDDRFAPFAAEKKTVTSLADKLAGKWTVTASDVNALTLDFCDAYVDGECVGEHIPVIDLEEICNAYEKQVHVKLVFRVKSDFDVPGKLWLVVEEAPFYTLSVNGKEIEKKYDGYYRDKTFIKLDISGAIVKGENVIVLETDFVQPQHIYETIKDCYEFEAMKNKLWYDREIEDIYLLGDFSVVSDKPFTSTPNRSLTTDGAFTLIPAVKELDAGDIVTQGYPFFIGEKTLTKTFTLTAEEAKNRVLAFEKLGAVILKANVNGNDLGTLMSAPYEYDLAGLLHEGENTVSVTLVSNFRNLLGPLHLGAESYSVGPFSFQHISKIFAGGRNGSYRDAYSFLEFGLFLR